MKLESCGNKTFFLSIQSDHGVEDQYTWAACQKTKKGPVAASVHRPRVPVSERNLRWERGFVSAEAGRARQEAQTFVAASARHHVTGTQ